MAQSFENLDNVFQTTDARFKPIRDMISLNQSLFFATHLNRLRIEMTGDGANIKYIKVSSSH